METRANYATIGVFTLAVIIACFAFVYWLARYDQSGVTKPLRILIPGSVTGLASGSQVLFNGIRIGAVTSLRINPDDPNQVEAMISVDPKQPIKADTKAAVAVQGLTGIASIELRGGSANLPSIFDQAEIPTLTAQGSGVQEILQSAQDLLQKANNTVDTLNSILSDAQPSVKTTLANVQKFTTALANNSDGIDSLLANVSKLSSQIGSLSDDVRGVLGRADGILAAVDPAKVSSTLTQIDRVASRLGESADTFPKIVANVDTLSQQMNDTVAEARRIMDAVDAQTVRSTIEDIATTSRNLASATVDADKIVGAAADTVKDARGFVAFLREQQPQVEQIVTSTNQMTSKLNTASDQLNSVLGGADRLVNDPNGQNFFREATQAAVSIRKVADSFAAHADTISTGFANFSDQGLRNINTLVSQLQRAATEFNRTLGALQNNPQALIFGNPSVREYNRK